MIKPQSIRRDTAGVAWGWITDPVGPATEATRRRQKLAVTPLPADKHAQARPRLSAPAEAREIRDARRAARDLSSRDGAQRGAGLSEEKISGERKSTRPQRGFTHSEEEARLEQSDGP